MMVSMCSVLSSHLCIFFENVSITVLLPLFHWIVCLLLFSCKYSLNILDTISSSDVWFANMFSHFVGFFFILLIVDLWCTKYLKFDEVQFTYFCCYSSCFCCQIQESIANPRSQKFTPMMYSKSVICLALTLRSLIHFDLFYIWYESSPQPILSLKKYITIHFNWHFNTCAHNTI